ncbi:hypothetical protein BVG19_g5677 [[Candida] boidinii]|nr:hypothetical protein BVG19_g5677 [[Candida] boidinii]OWB51534.1 hypothetical protein B5S27_g3098 [[Candida] boidinii]
MMNFNCDSKESLPTDAAPSSNVKNRNTKINTKINTNPVTISQSEDSNSSLNSNDFYLPLNQQGFNNTNNSNVNNDHHTRQSVRNVPHNAGLTTPVGTQAPNTPHNHTLNTQIDTTTPVQQIRNIDSPLNSIAKTNPPNQTRTSNNATGTPAHQLTRRNDSAATRGAEGSPAATLPPRLKQHVETAGTRTYNTRMTTIDANDVSELKINLRRKITVPQYFIDYIKHSNISAGSPSVTSKNGTAVDKQLLFEHLKRFREALLEHPDFKEKVLDYYCSFEPEIDHNSSGVNKQYLYTFCIPETEIYLHDVPETQRIFDLHLEFLYEYFESNPDFRIHPPDPQTYSQLLLIKLDYDHETMLYQDSLYERILEPYGSLIYQELPKFRSFAEGDPMFSAYYLIDFNSDTVPQKTVFPFTKRRRSSELEQKMEQGKVTVTIQSNLKFCFYCKKRDHYIESCTAVGFRKDKTKLQALPPEYQF